MKDQQGGQGAWSEVTEGRDVDDEVRELLGSWIMWGHAASVRTLASNLNELGAMLMGKLQWRVSYQRCRREGRSSVVTSLSRRGEYGKVHGQRDWLYTGAWVVSAPAGAA